MNEKFRELVKDAPQSGWLKHAKRRQRWWWFRKLTLKPMIKYYRLKRKYF